MDVLAELRAALERFAEFRRRPRKQKKVKVANRRPAKMGASAGCGTGAGGFKAGNNCAKEDGIPRKPLSQGGALKKSDAKKDIAAAKALAQKEKAAKEQKMASDVKQRRIEGLRKSAAERKAQKGERDAAEKQAAAEAAAAKKAAMLQKIRIKKANEQLKVVEKPPDRFSGDADDSIQKSPGETQFEYAKRRVDADLKKLHQELDASEAKAESRRQDVLKRIESLEKDVRSRRDDAQNFARTILAGNRKPTRDEVEQQKMLDKVKDDANKKLADAYRERNSIDSELAVEHHDIISDFVKSHGKGLADFRAEDQFYDAAAIAKTRSKYAESFKENTKTAWSFLSKVSAPLHQEKGRSIRVKLDTEAGDADYNDITQISRHGVYGKGEYNTSAGVIVHEIAHGLHYGPHVKTSAYGPDGRPRLPSVQDGYEWLQSPAYRARAAIKEDYDARVATLRSQNQQGLEQIVYHPERQNYKMWKPAGRDRQKESYLGYADQYCDAENGNATGATEVISVGIEQLYRNPRALRGVYRSHFDITILFLAGRLH